MKAVIRKVGNSRGVLIPKPLLVQAGIDTGEAELRLEGNVIVLRAVRQRARVGWAEASKKLVVAGKDVLVWPAFANEADGALKW
jgi:antitoxin MazE